MKLFKDDDMYISRRKWKQIFLAFSIMVLALYLVAMIFSLCGSDYFILNYQNAQMDKIEAWFREKDILAIINLIYITIESTIVLAFTLKELPKWYYIISYYLINIMFAFIFKNSFQAIFTISQIFLTIIFIFINNLVKNHKHINWKEVLFCFIRFGIATIVTLILQAMILVIKAGYFDGINHIQPLSSAFAYAIEYDIALSVILFTVYLYIDREKGDGTTGRHWSVEETDAVAKQYGVEFTHIDKYDWNYVMNMIYSDYYDSVPNDISTYVKLAKKFLFDKDAPEGKAFKYYMAMKE